MAKKTKDSNLSIEERLEQALIPNWDEPYKLPPNWCWTKLESIAKWGSGGTPSRKNPEYYIGNIPWIKTGELDNAYIYDTEEHISEKALANSSAKLFPINTVVIAMYGATIGKVGIMGIEATTNQACACAVSSSAIDYKYLFYYAISQRDAFIGKGKGGAQPNISQDIIKQHEIPLPPLAEQRRIVAHIESFFAKLDEAKEKAQEVVDGFETRKAAILHKAFSGELTEKWRKENTPAPACEYLEELKNDDNYSIRSEIKYWNNESLPAGWCESKIGNLLYFAGRIGWKGLKAEEYTASGPLLLSVYNLNDGDEVTYNRVYHITQERYEESPEIMVEIGDVLLTKDGAGIGKLGYVKELPEKATINSSLLLLRPSKSAVSKYIYYVLLGPALQSIVKERITGSATPHLFQRDIKEFVLPIPSLEEQIEIVRILDNMLLNENKAKESAELVLEQIDVIKKSILVRAFRGELGTNDPTEASAIELIKQIVEEKIKAEESKPKRTQTKRKEVGFVAKTILEVLKFSEKLTPEKLKAETSLEVDDFYDQLKVLIDNGQIREIRIEGESYLEAVK